MGGGGGGGGGGGAPTPMYGPDVHQPCSGETMFT